MTSLPHLCKIAIVVIFAFNLELNANVPNENDINLAIEQSQTAYKEFNKQSFKTRMHIEYKNHFFSAEDKQNLQGIAQKTSKKLNQLINKQENLKKQIENYNENDWEQRFGQNKLFRKLVNSLYLTKVNKLKTDFVLAITLDDYNRNKAFKQILKNIESQDKSPKSLGLIKAKIYALLAKVDKAYFDIAEKELSNLMLCSDISQRTAIESTIEYYKLTYKKPEQKEDILNYKLPDSFANDLELLLPLVFLQRKINENAFEKAIEKNPEIKSFLAALILDNLNSNADFENITRFEAGLAVLSAWQQGPEKHTNLLENLSSNEKFKTPLVLYVTAISIAKDEPQKSANLLIKTSKLQKNNFDSMLNLNSEKIASQSCLLAYKTFAQQKEDEDLTIQTFQNYFQLADKNADPKIKYLYCDILDKLNKKEDSRKLLKEISNNQSSPYRCNAKYDLIINDIKQKSQNNLVSKLRELVYDCRKDNQPTIELQATTLYCDLIFKNSTMDNAEKILSLLKDSEIKLNAELLAFKAKAYLLTNNFLETTRTVLKFEANCNYQYQIFSAFEQTANNLDQTQYNQQQLDELQENCREIFETFSNCFDKSQKTTAELYLTEIIIFSNQHKSAKLEQIRKKLNSMPISAHEKAEMLRCRARIAMYQQKFAQAEKLWGKFCSIIKNKDNIPIGINNLWWKGKYYQLYCFKNSPNSKQSELSHIIEVLEHTYPDKDEFWELKISALK